MRFVSKNSNLRVVLEPGLSAQPLSGFAGKQPVYVKFEQGVVEIKDEGLIQKMLQHPGLTRHGDFIAVEDNVIDPFIDRREEIEPVHVHTNIKYGHVEASTASPLRKSKVNPELKKLVNDLAMKQINEMLPGMVANGVKQVLAAMKSEGSVMATAPATPAVEEDEEDISGLTPEDFEDEVDDGSQEAEEDVNAKTDAPGGVKLSDLSPEAAAVAASFIGKKKPGGPGRPKGSTSKK